MGREATARATGSWTGVVQKCLQVVASPKAGTLVAIRSKTPAD